MNDLKELVYNYVKDNPNKLTSEIIEYCSTKIPSDCNIKNCDGADDCENFKSWDVLEALDELKEEGKIK